jgi:hypothetical protein
MNICCGSGARIFRFTTFHRHKIFKSRSDEKLTYMLQPHVGRQNLILEILQQKRVSFFWRPLFTALKNSSPEQSAIFFLGGDQKEQKNTAARPA